MCLLWRVILAYNAKSKWASQCCKSHLTQIKYLMSVVAIGLCNMTCGVIYSWSLCCVGGASSAGISGTSAFPIHLLWRYGRCHWPLSYCDRWARTWKVHALANHQSIEWHTKVVARGYEGRRQGSWRHGNTHQRNFCSGLHLHLRPHYSFSRPCRTARFCRSTLHVPPISGLPKSRTDCHRQQVTSDRYPHESSKIGWKFDFHTLYW